MRRTAKSFALSADQRLYLLLGIYWGEGCKTELSLINSDPGLVKTFMLCLGDLGVSKEHLKISLRLHKGLDADAAIKFWADFLSIDRESILSINVIHGRKAGKLKYGMCRVRVAKSAPYFKLLMSLIQEIKSRFDALVVQRIE